VSDESNAVVPFMVTRPARWPDHPVVSMNAWMCDCGAHGLTDSQPGARGALEEHLRASGHRRGEYYYGGRDQRTAVAVTADPDGRFTHALR
jgi:hypothetical protein